VALWWACWSGGVALVAWQLAYGATWAFDFVTDLRVASPASVKITGLPPSPRIARRLLAYEVTYVTYLPGRGAETRPAILLSTQRHELGERLVAYSRPGNPGRFRERAWEDFAGGLVLALLAALFGYVLLFHLQPWSGSPLASCPPDRPPTV
jgi:hypothetical protein